MVIMAKQDTDSFGNRMKQYESIEVDRILLPKTPIYARLDGKSFHTFTRGMKRPYDEELSQMMVDTTKYLVDKTNALIGYTQSDEISLVWYYPDPESEALFGGRTMKLCSILAGLCSSFFTAACLDKWPHMIHSLPSFDCRVLSLPNKEEAANMFLWRNSDAAKNAISMAARAYFPHKELQNKSGSMMQEMLFQNHRINFNDYPVFFKRGTFVRKLVENVVLTEEEQSIIPAKFRPGNKAVIRSRVVDINMPSFRKVTNRVGVIFDGEQPKVIAES